MNKLELIEQIHKNLETYFDDCAIVYIAPDWVYEYKGSGVWQQRLLSKGFAIRTISTEDINIEALKKINQNINDEIEKNNKSDERPLTVGELIEHLQKFNPNSVITYNNEDDFKDDPQRLYTFDFLKEIKLYKNKSTYKIYQDFLGRDVVGLNGWGYD